MHLSQVALSVVDLDKAQHFYGDVLGFAPAGGTDAFRGPIVSKVQGLSDAVSVCRWLVDRRDFMQLELFAFESPPVRALPPDWRANDIGYSSIGVHVQDFDAVLGRLADAAVESLTPPLGEVGDRRVCLRDPDGILVELMEHDPFLSGDDGADAVSARVVGVRLSVPDLDRARRFWVDALGLPEAAPGALDTPEHDLLWHIREAETRSLLLDADGSAIELVEYLEPRGRPWPEGYRISDQGLVNIAFGFRDKDELLTVFDRVVAAGYVPNSDPLDVGEAASVYLNDDQGFSVELVYIAPSADHRFGFVPIEADRS